MCMHYLIVPVTPGRPLTGSQELPATKTASQEAPAPKTRSQEVTQERGGKELNVYALTDCSCNPWPPPNWVPRAASN